MLLKAYGVHFLSWVESVAEDSLCYALNSAPTLMPSVFKTLHKKLDLSGTLVLDELRYEVWVWLEILRMSKTGIWLEYEASGDLILSSDQDTRDYLIKGNFDQSANQE